MRIRYKQKTRQHMWHMSLMDCCLARLIKRRARQKNKIRYASEIELNYLQYAGAVRFKVRSTQTLNVPHCHSWFCGSFAFSVCILIFSSIFRILPGI